MSIKDIVKLLCILSGYDNNFSFETWFTDDITCKGYDVYATDDEDNMINVSAAMGSIDLIDSLLREIKENPHHTPPFWCKDVPYKVLLNDEWRKLQKERHILYQKYCDERINLEQPISEHVKENNPCPNCKINTKDHWDDIHYNCESHHTMSCPILWEFMNKRDEIAKEVYNSPEFKKLNEEYYKKEGEISEKSIKIYNDTMKKNKKC